MQDGIQLDQGTLIEVLQNKIAQGAIREAQMEAAVYQLQSQNEQLRREHEPAEVERASADQ